MRKNYPIKFKALSVLFLLLFTAACKKDTQNPSPGGTTTTGGNFAVLGMYEELVNGYRRLYMAIPKVGDVTTPNYGLVFDTGSTGMTLDAKDVIPASMITANGFQFDGDSVNVKGITITSQTAIISYGNAQSSLHVYGNLAYAKVVIGDGNGSVTTPRIPFFLYYKILDENDKPYPAHSADVFGVGPGVSYTSRKIASPLSYFKLGTGQSNGFRLAKLNAANFLSKATYTDKLLYIGLTQADLNSSGFIMHVLKYNAISGYVANITSTITYGSTTVAANILFDTGNPAITLIQNAGASSNTADLTAGTSVSLTTSSGFSYQYTVAANNNLTTVQKPSYSGDTRTVYSLNFFLDNQFLLDYANNRIGLKNN